MDGLWTTLVQMILTTGLVCICIHEVRTFIKGRRDNDQSTGDDT